MTATTIGRWGKLRILVFGVNSSQKINIYHWKCVGKSFWENGMNVACGMEMSISLKPCGAEVYACNVGEMQCKVSL
jgi:hypothetical protein